MIGKITKLINKGLAQVSKIKVKSNLWVTIFALALLFGSLILYLGTWIYLMFWTNKTTLAELKEIITVICGAPLIAAVSTLRGGLVDRDGDGVADVDEEARK